MPQIYPDEIKKFLKTLRTEIKTTDPDALQKRADVAVGKLSEDAKDFFYASKSLLNHAVKENKPYFVKALLKKNFNTNFLNVNNITNPLAHLCYFDANTLEIIKILKYFGADINVSIAINVGKAFDLLGSAMYSLQPSAVLNEIIAELIPTFLDVKACTTLAEFKGPIFTDTFLTFQSKFTPEVLQNIFFVATNFSTHKPKFNSDLKQIFLLIFPPLLQQNINNQPLLHSVLATAMDRLLLLFHDDISQFFPIEFVKDPDLFHASIPILNHPGHSLKIYKKKLALNPQMQEWEAQYNRIITDIINFVFKVFALIEESTGKRLIELDIPCSSFLSSLASMITKKRNLISDELDESFTKNMNPVNYYKLLESRSDWQLQFFGIHLLCDSKQFGDYFLKELYQYQPALLAELMHVGNVEFTLFLYDRVNQIAKSSLFKPEIVMAALRSNKLVMLGQVPIEALLSSLKPAKLSSPKPENTISYLNAGSDIVKYIVQLANNSRTLLSVAMLTTENRERYMNNEQFGRGEWLSVRESLKASIEKLNAITCDYKVNHDIYQRIISEAKRRNNIKATFLLQNFLNIRTTEDKEKLSVEISSYANPEEVQMMLNMRDLYFNWRFAWRPVLIEITKIQSHCVNSYKKLASDSNLSNEQKQQLKSSAPNEKGLLGFWTIFSRKNQMMQIAYPIQLASGEEPAQKKQKLN